MTHMIRSGDNLISIAELYNTTINYSKRVEMRKNAHTQAPV